MRSITPMGFQPYSRVQRQDIDLRSPISFTKQGARILAVPQYGGLTGSSTLMTPMNQSLQVSNINKKMQRISIHDANLVDTRKYIDQYSPFKSRKGRNSVMDQRGTIDLSLQSVNMQSTMNHNTNADTHYRTAKNTTTRNSIAGNSPPPSVLYSKGGSSMKVAINTPLKSQQQQFRNNEKNYQNQSITANTTPKNNGQFLRTQNFSSLTHNDKNLDVTGFPAGLVKRSQSPGPGGQSLATGTAGRRPQQPPIPFYLRGTSVNEKMLAAGQQPGMAMGFVSDYQSHDHNQKAQASTRDASMNVPGMPTVKEMIEVGFKATFNLKEPKFGVKGYNLQDTYSFEPLYTAPKIAVNKLEKADHFTDLHAKLTKAYPPCKVGHVGWEKAPPFATAQHAKKYQFLKGPKLTMSAMTIQDAKKRNVPAPNAYKLQPLLGAGKRADRSDARDLKYCGFIEDVTIHGLQNPTAKVDRNYNQIDKKAKTAGIWAEGEWQKKNDIRVSPIGKGKDKAPGDYHFNRPEDSFKKSQQSPDQFNFTRDKLVCFTEVYARRKSYVPHAAQYKYDNRALSKLSGSPRSLAIRRH